MSRRRYVLAKAPGAAELVAIGPVSNDDTLNTISGLCEDRGWETTGVAREMSWREFRGEPPAGGAR